MLYTDATDARSFRAGAGTDVERCRRLGAIFCPGCRSAIAAEAAACLGCTLVRPHAGWPVDQQVGRVFQGKYRVDSRLASGGFGTVFLAMQVHGGVEMGRVILKFLHPEHAADPSITKRFFTEVKTARELINPHIVRVFDLGYDDDGTPFMVQEFIEGEGMDEILEREKRLAPSAALKIASQVAEGMAEAHRKQIIHRDLKPENLRIQRGTGIVKILDFGIARVATARGTATNSFIGTPRYMPPEQIKQQKLDNGVDIFALGVILFEALAGEPPILHEQSELEYIHLNLIQDPRKLVDLVDGCPPELSDFVDSMLAKDRAARPADMEAVVSALQGFALKHGWTSETAGRFHLTTTAAGGGGRTAALPTRERTPSPATPESAADEEEILELVPAAPRRGAARWVAVGGAAAAVVAAVLAFALRGGDDAPAGRSAAPPAATQEVAPAPPEPASAGPAAAAAADAGAKVEPSIDDRSDAGGMTSVVAVEMDAGAAAKIDPDAAARPPEIVPPVFSPPDAVATVEPDVGSAPAADAGAGRSRDAGAGRSRDAGTRASQDAGTGTSGRPGQDAGGFQFTKVGIGRDGG